MSARTLRLYHQSRLRTLASILSELPGTYIRLRHAAARDTTRVPRMALHQEAAVRLPSS